MIAADPVLTMLGLNVVMIVYTLWVFSLDQPSQRMSVAVAVALSGWLLLLHVGLSNQWLFDPKVSGVAFLGIILLGVSAVGVVLFGVPAFRRRLLQVSQRQLLLAQGIRVSFGAMFLMQSSTGVLPQAFGVVDGFTHIGAGFFGLVAAFLVSIDDRARRWAWFANLFGLFDILIVATTLALVLLPVIGPHHPMMYAVFLPAPLWFWFHIVSLYRLLMDGRRRSPIPVGV